MIANRVWSLYVLDCICIMQIRVFWMEAITWRHRCCHWWHHQWWSSSWYWGWVVAEADRMRKSKRYTDKLRTTTTAYKHLIAAYRIKLRQKIRNVFFDIVKQPCWSLNASRNHCYSVVFVCLTDIDILPPPAGALGDETFPPAPINNHSANTIKLTLISCKIFLECLSPGFLWTSSSSPA